MIGLHGGHTCAPVKTYKWNQSLPLTQIMEFCSRVILVAVVWLTLYFMEPAISQRWEDMKIDAKAVEEPHGGINISWNVQPASYVVSVRPRIEIYTDEGVYYMNEFLHSLAMNSQCFPRQFTKATYQSSLDVYCVDHDRPYTQYLGMFRSINICKLLNSSMQMPILNAIV